MLTISMDWRLVTLNELKKLGGSGGSFYIDGDKKTIEFHIMET